MRQVLLYGELGKMFGREHRLAVRSASEAIQAMCVNHPGFKKYMMTAHKSGVGFKVLVGKGALRKVDEAALPSGENEAIRIAPALFGSQAFVRILIGAALIVGGIFTGGATLGLGVFGSIGIGSAMKVVGASLVLGGVSELLSSPPKVNLGDTSDRSQSYIFSGPENVTRQGGGVPVGYGRMMVGSTVVSAGIQGEDQA
jgi:predicted phage tail protein